MAKTKKRRHLYGKKEFLFNFFSLIIVIAIGLYFGYRSIYYYTKQNEIHNGNNQNLGDVIINSNRLESKEDGLHRDEDGYFFKGNVSNNYVTFANRLFRIVRVNNDGSIKLISNDIVSIFMFGDDTSYSKSNLRIWLEKTDDKYSGVYYNTLPNPTDYLVKTTYTEDILKEEKIKDSKKKYSDYITTLSLKDYTMAGGKSSYLNNGKMYHLLGLSKEKNNLYIEEDGTVSEGDSTTGYGVRVVITLKEKTVSAYGNGNIDNPYTINLSDSNYINSIVKLGNDYYTVYKEENEILRLYKNDYIKKGKVIVKEKYSKKINEYTLNDYNNISRYLNNDYFKSLSYNNIIVDTVFYTGELGEDGEYKYETIYKDKTTCKVGLLNIFDYHQDNNKDFFYMNTSIGDMQYINNEKGMLEEVEVKEEKPIIPVISINKSILKYGKGTIEDPYVMG